MRRARPLLLLGAALLLSACGQLFQAPAKPGPGTAPPAPPPGGLRVEVAGLPEGLQAEVVVVGPDGYTQPLVASASLSGLAPGVYTVRALAVNLPSGDSYLPEQAAQDVAVSSNRGASVRVAYAAAPLRLAPGTVGLPPQSAAAETLQPMEPAGLVGDKVVRTLRFDGVPAALAGLKPGSYLGLPSTADNPYGFLGQVEEVSTAGGDLTVTAHLAPLPEVIQQGGFSFYQEVDGEDPGVRAQLAKAEVLLPGARVLTAPTPQTEELKRQLFAEAKAQAQQVYPASAARPNVEFAPICLEIKRAKILPGDGPDDGIFMEGSTCLRISFDGSIWISAKGIEASFSATARQTGKLKVFGKGRIYQQVTATVPLMVLPLPPINISVAGFPVVINPTVSVRFVVGGSITSEFYVKAEESVSLTAGVSFDGKNWNPFSSERHSISFDSGGSMQGFSVLAGVGPQVNFYFYGVYGPDFALVPYLEFDANFTRDPWWQLYLGFKAFMGLNANISYGFSGPKEVLQSAGLFFLGMLSDFKYEVLNMKFLIAQAPPSQRPVIVRISPEQTSVPACGRTVLRASIQNSLKGVTWAASGGAVLGDDVMNSATYFAPPTPGTYTVTATSAEQPGQQASAQVTVTPGGSGPLTVVVTGLPAGTVPSLRLTGPNGFFFAPKTSGSSSGEGVYHFECLPEGAYTLTAGLTPAGDAVYSPNQGSDRPALQVVQSASVGPGQTPRLQVNYNNVRANLKVVVSGLPDGVQPAVAVSGPLGYTHTVSASGETLLQLLNPGTYKITAASLEHGGYTYTPALSQAEVVLPPSETTTVTVSYSSNSPRGLWVANQMGSNQNVLFYPAGGTALAQTTMGGGLTYTPALAFDPQGRLWVADAFLGKVLAYPADRLKQSPDPLHSFALPSSPQALAFDAQGNLWVALQAPYGSGEGGQVLRYPAAGLLGAAPTPDLTLNADGAYRTPMSLALDGEGNLWVAYNGSAQVVRYAAAGGYGSATAYPLAQGRGNLSALTFGPTGRLWVGTTGASVLEYDPSALVEGQDATPLTHVHGFNGGGSIGGLAFDPEGNLYASVYSSSFMNGVFRWSPAYLAQKGDLDPYEGIGNIPTYIAGITNPVGLAYWPPR